MAAGPLTEIVMTAFDPAHPPIEIEVPRASPGSLHRDNGTGYQWTLILMSDDGQTPVSSAGFEVPVYRREDLEPA